MTFDEIWKVTSDINDHYSMDPADVRMVIDLADQFFPDGCIFLELGVCHGRTFATIALFAQLKGGHAAGIDHFGLEGSAEEVRQTLAARGITEYTLIEQNTHDVKWNTPVDLLIVDAGHDEENVRRDIEQYLPFVEPGGVVVFDDYDWTHTPGSAHAAIWTHADRECRDWIDVGAGNRARAWRRPL